MVPPVSIMSSIRTQVRPSTSPTTSWTFASLGTSGSRRLWMIASGDAEHVGPALGDPHPAGVRGDHGDQVAVLDAVGDVPDQQRQREQVVDGAVEEALDLARCAGRRPSAGRRLRSGTGRRSGAPRWARGRGASCPAGRSRRTGATTVMRLAEARLSASTMISCSMIHLLIGSVWLCITNASQPRTDSSKRTKISPLAKSYAGRRHQLDARAPRRRPAASSGWERPADEHQPLLAGLDRSRSLAVAPRA